MDTDKNIDNENADGTDTSNEGWYVKTFPKGPCRSRDAYIRERLRSKTERIEESIEHAFRDSYVSAWEIVNEEIGGTSEETVRMLSECASEHIVEALIEQSRQEGGLECTRDKAIETWEPHAKAHAKAWIEKQAPAEDWDAVLRALRETKPDTGERAISMYRLRQLARRGSSMVEKIRACDPWVAREVCWHMDDEMLDEDANKWSIRIVQMESQLLTKNDNVDEADALKALEHWRWPEMMPPLEFVASAAGRLPPLRSDSAWANAIRTPARRVEDGHTEWVRTRRMDEEGTAREAVEKLRSVARDRVHTSTKEEAEKIIGRCRNEWEKTASLKGDGHVGLPTLDIVEDDDGGGRHMMWVFNVHGPEVLLAGCMFERMEVADVLAAHDIARVRIGLDIGRTVKEGRLFELDTPQDWVGPRNTLTLSNIIKWTGTNE